MHMTLQCAEESNNVAALCRCLHGLCVFTRWIVPRILALSCDRPSCLSPTAWRRRGWRERRCWGRTEDSVARRKQSESERRIRGGGLRFVCEVHCLLSPVRLLSRAPCLCSDLDARKDSGDRVDWAPFVLDDVQTQRTVGEHWWSTHTQRQRQGRQRSAAEGERETQLTQTTQCRSSDALALASPLVPSGHTIRVKHLANKLDRRRFLWIILPELHGELEHTSFPLCIRGSKDTATPREGCRGIHRGPTDSLGRITLHLASIGGQALDRYAITAV